LPIFLLVDNRIDMMKIDGGVSWSEKKTI